VSITPGFAGVTLKKLPVIDVGYRKQGGFARREEVGRATATDRELVLDAGVESSAVGRI
jgi:hypothetical protein